MGGYSDLTEPTTREFQYYGTGAPPSRVLLDRTFLGGAYYEDYKNEKQETKYNYGQEFFREVEEEEIPYTEIIVTWHTLATVVAHLQSKWSMRGASDCLERFRDEDKFRIYYPQQDIYENSLAEFLGYEGERPNLHEIADHLVMEELEISRCIGWDNDLTAFEDITLMPHGYWRR